MYGACDRSISSQLPEYIDFIYSLCILGVPCLGFPIHSLYVLARRSASDVVSPKASWLQVRTDNPFLVFRTVSGAQPLHLG